jgi:hypothetical protein
MPVPLLDTESPASRVSVKSRTAVKNLRVYNDPDSGMSIRTLSATSALDGSLRQSPTCNIESKATSESTYMSAPPTGVAIENCEAHALKPAAVTMFAPTAIRLDAARRPHTPFHSPDTPHPRLSRPLNNEWPVSQQTPAVHLQTTAPSVPRSQSSYCDTRREDFKHAMFLAWLDRRSTD